MELPVRKDHSFDFIVYHVKVRPWDRERRASEMEQRLLSDAKIAEVNREAARKRNLWDFDDLTVYECQTNALREEIEKGIGKARALNARLIWVAGVKEVAEGIRNVGGGDCMIV